MVSKQINRNGCRGEYLMDDKYGIRWGMFDNNGNMKEACETCSGSGLKDFKFYDDAPHVGTAVCTKCNGSGE